MRRTHSDECNKFPVKFDSEAYLRACKGRQPLQPFEVSRTSATQRETLYDALRLQAAQIFREPTGALRYPYIVPGGVYQDLWDWDGFFCGLALCEERPEYFQGCVLNFLDHLTPDGKPPHLISPNSGPSYGSLPLPLFAQWAAIASRVLGDIAWLRPWWDRLLLQRQWYDRTCLGRRGLYRLQIWKGHGLDNDPVIYGRRGNTVAAVHVNCYHFRELKALALLAARLGFPKEASTFSTEAASLAQSINEYMWDPIDGLHYHLDLSDFEDVHKQEITWEVPYKVRSWACLYPLWAGVCTAKQADRIVSEHVLNPDEFLSPFGIRSLAANERIYNNAAMGGPSNWQGPVWGMSTFLSAYGLARYGFKTEAADVARRLLDVFYADCRVNGVLHEYYHADTGAPVIKPGFMSWNLLAVRVVADIENGFDPARFADE